VPVTVTAKHTSRRRTWGERKTVDLCMTSGAPPTKPKRGVLRPGRRRPHTGASRARPTASSRFTWTAATPTPPSGSARPSMALRAGAPQSPWRPATSSLRPLDPRGPRTHHLAQGPHHLQPISFPPAHPQVHPLSFSSRIIPQERTILPCGNRTLSLCGDRNFLLMDREKCDMIPASFAFCFCVLYSCPARPGKGWSG